ncbi:encapsulin-associated ferritin-like protein [Wolinella succinogenes]|uniref:Ferritin n=1 Tax=Wolinella succinogenes (strain ATCC 29543 / DSM 1740 / CCUG 13145 / JCM 31913 / LMG 7466 / NCTC 11488 / FDC 602W) TaxID=273121 RepID=Q7MSN0_WOLSU|nr:ferritin-like domain-containing protein [Wolinella succinogenes]NLU34559.1 ferritin [Wolinella succinogenes]CAE09437.1 conserved hypothetical protein [Wolinella succinogenes]VEG81650.1 Uncharacterized conserved protein [Wolinella succinogenes]HCZ19861.1 ferritin [Helicobacter sp.]
MVHEGAKEAAERLPEEVVDYHRIIQSTIEELEAVDLYNQRAAATKDPAVRAIMEHNRDEEIEHAVMGLEWLRRHSPVWDETMRALLFKEGEIISHEQAFTGKTGEVASALGSNGLNIGSLKKGK